MKCASCNLPSFWVFFDISRFSVHLDIFDVHYPYHIVHTVAEDIYGGTEGARKLAMYALLAAGDTRRRAAGSGEQGAEAGDRQWFWGNGNAAAGNGLTTYLIARHPTVPQVATPPLASSSDGREEKSVRVSARVM